DTGYNHNSPLSCLSLPDFTLYQTFADGRDEIHHITSFIPEKIKAMQDRTRLQVRPPEQPPGLQRLERFVLTRKALADFWPGSRLGNPGIKDAHLSRSQDGKSCDRVRIVATLRNPYRICAGNLGAH